MFIACFLAFLLVYSLDTMNIPFFVSTVYAQASEKAAVNTEQVEWFKEIAQGALKWGGAVGILFLSFIFASIAKKIVVRRLSGKGEDYHREVIILFERITYFVVLMIGITIALSLFEVDFVSFLGFFTLGIGFALKDLLGNFIAGVVILNSKKFKIGDFIKIGDKLGTITNIETRTTDIKSIDGTQLVIPNAHLMTDVVQNFTSNAFRRITVVVGVHYDTPLRDVIALTIKTADQHPDVLPDPRTQVLATEFGDSSISLDVRFWVDSHANWQSVRSEVIQAIKIAYDKAGVVIPFPIRTLSIDSYDENLMGMLHKKPHQKPLMGATPAPTVTPPVASS